MQNRNRKQKRQNEKPTLALLCCYGKALVGRHIFLGHCSSAMRQDYLNVHTLLLAQTEVSHGFLTRAVTKANTDLARSQEGGSLAQLADRVQQDAGANAHAIDPS